MDEEAKAVQESTKAVQELAKTTRHALDAFGDLGPFLTKLVGEPAVEISGMLTDWLRFKRENFDRIRRKTNELLSSRGIGDQTRPIPLRHALPLIESASLEDDELLQNMWAGLIANAINPRKRFQAKKLIRFIITQLEPLDGIVLQYIFEDRKQKPAICNPYTLSKILGQSSWDLSLSMINLYRLGLIYSQHEPPLIDTFDQCGRFSHEPSISGPRTDDEKAHFSLTELGNELMDACGQADNDETTL